MRVIRTRTPSLQGATGLPRLCSEHVRHVRHLYHSAVQVPTAHIRKVHWGQSVHFGVVNYHEGHLESYT